MFQFTHSTPITYFNSRVDATNWFHQAQEWYNQTKNCEITFQILEENFGEPYQIYCEIQSTDLECLKEIIKELLDESIAYEIVDLNQQTTSLSRQSKHLSILTYLKSQSVDKTLFLIGIAAWILVALILICSTYIDLIPLDKALYAYMFVVVLTVILTCIFIGYHIYRYFQRRNLNE